MIMISLAAVVLSCFGLVVSINGFTIDVSSQPARSTLLHMGLFDGVKEAFAAPARTTMIDSERETPIDRWMGWSVTKEKDMDSTGLPSPQAFPVDYVDSMDVSNYVFVELNKPMGIIFEENDSDFGGIFVHSLKENGAASSLPIQVGDQLVAVQKQKVSGLPFDEALSAITASPDNEKVQLILFRGRASQFYGPTGASQEWLDELIAGKMSQKIAGTSNE